MLLSDYAICEKVGKNGLTNEQSPSKMVAYKKAKKRRVCEGNIYREPVWLRAGDGKFAEHGLGVSV